MSIPYSVWAIARLRSGAELNTINAERISGDWRELLGVLRSVNGGNRQAAFEQFVGHHPNGKAMLKAVADVPPTLTDYPEEATTARDRVIVVNLPELPKEARLSPSMTRAAADTGEWLGAYADHVGMIVNTLPRDFAEAAALSVASIAIARRLYCSPYFEPELFPVMWCLWVAESTVFHKTTALNIARRLIRNTMPHLLLPDESSSDRLIQELAGIAPSNLKDMPLEQQQRWGKAKAHAGQRGIVIDEASSLFGSFRKDYNIGKVEVFLKAYDCDEEKTYSTIRHGQVTMRWLYLPLLGATTPAAIQAAANVQMWQMGLWPRFVTLVPERMFPEKLIHQDALVTRPKAIDTGLNALLSKLPPPEESNDLNSFGQAQAPKAKEVPMASEVWRHFTKYTDAMMHTLQDPDLTPDDRLRKMYGRNPTKLLQVATLLAALDWAGEKYPLKINLAHYARAHQIVETWRVNAHRFVELIDRPLEGSDREARMVTMIRYLATKGEAPTTRNLTRYIGWKREDVQGILNQMLNDGLIEESNTGRAKAWRLTNDKRE